MYPTPHYSSPPSIPLTYAYVCLISFSGNVNSISVRECVQIPFAHLDRICGSRSCRGYQIRYFQFQAQLSSFIWCKPPFCAVRPGQMYKLQFYFSSPCFRSVELCKWKVGVSYELLFSCSTLSSGGGWKLIFTSPPTHTLRLHLAQPATASRAHMAIYTSYV